MSEQVIVAVDPGSKESAFVVVAPATGGKIRLVRAAMVPGTCEAMAEFLDETINSHRLVQAVAIEWAVGFAYQPFRVPHLLAAQGVAGELSGLAYDRYIQVLRQTAPKWRAAVVGKLPRAVKIAGVKTPKPNYDALIARALSSFFDGLESNYGNVHSRDAMGLAAWASREVWKRVT